MARTLSGTDFISYFRRLKDKDTTDAARLRFETESTISEEMEVNSTVTKEGVKSVVSNGENTADFSSLAYSNDTDTIEVWKELRTWFRQKEEVEFWNVNRATLTDTNQVDVDYHTGLFTSFEMSLPADGEATLSYSYVINEMAEGVDTLDQSQLEELSDEIDYQTMKATGAGV